MFDPTVLFLYFFYKIEKITQKVTFSKLKIKCPDQRIFTVSGFLESGEKCAQNQRGIFLNFA